MQRVERGSFQRRQGVHGRIERICTGTGVDKFDQWFFAKENGASGYIVQSEDAETFEFGVADLNEGSERVGVAERHWRE